MHHLIVNADDFGLSRGVNAGVVQAHECGIVTSASLMVLQPAAEEAAAYAQGRPTLGLGLHVDLGEWIFRDERWHALYERVPPKEAAAVESEVLRQLARFRELVGRDPDHFDSHQHVHRGEPAGSIVRALARRLDRPLRGAGAIHYCGQFYGQDDDGNPLPSHISVDALLAMFDRLPCGVTELACHPGFVDNDDPLGGTSYRAARNAEVSVLCDARVRAGLQARGISLVTYAEAARIVEAASNEQP